MRSLRTWLALAITIPAAVGLFLLGRLLFYNQMPAYENRVAFAQHILAYNRIACPHPDLFDYGEGAITLQCRDPDATRYNVYAMESCSESLGCRWFGVLCWYVSSPTPDAPT